MSLTMIDTPAGVVGVHTTGDGPPMVLLHANGTDHHDFDAVAPALACRMVGSPVLARTVMRWLPQMSVRERNDWTRAAARRARAAAADPARVEVFASMWRSFAAPCHDAAYDAGALDVPTLLVWGTRDPVLPWRIDGRRAVTALPGAQVVTLRCGHQAHLELPGPFLDVASAFLRPVRDDLVGA